MKKPAFIFISFLLIASCASGQIIYVDANAPSGGDGLTWGTAYNYLQDALTYASSHPDVNEIWVAQGIYTPDSNESDPSGNGDRTATFELIDEVALYGGFAGGESSLEQRNWQANETILSGDLDANDTPGLDPCDLPNAPNRAENSYHVVTGSGTDANTILDGFTITAGNANGSYPNETGGGMDNGSGSPTVNNCTFIGNSADYGGGMFNVYPGRPTVTNCTFRANSAYEHGGGMYNWADTGPCPICEGYGPIVTNCSFFGNSAGEAGGGMHNRFTSPTVTNCTFIGNSASSGAGMHYSSFDMSMSLTNCIFSANTAEQNGGGIGGGGTNMRITNCIFSANTAGQDGGGISCLSTIRITNCTFSTNTAKLNGGGIRVFASDMLITNCTFSGNTSGGLGGGIFSYFHSTSSITNSIFWDNTAADGNEMALEYDSTVDVNYSDVMGGQTAVYDPCECLNWGLGNIDEDPCFVAAGYWDANGTPSDANDDFWVDGDYHLKSEGWRWDISREVWTWDDVTSRCIDAGNPGSSLGDELLSVPDDQDNEWGENLRINMGAYGGTTEASMPPYDWALLADLTNDGTADWRDYCYMADEWLATADEQPGDLNRNGVVNLADVRLLTQNWLRHTIWYEGSQ